jgi:hypothetical protein
MRKYGTMRRIALAAELELRLVCKAAGVVREAVRAGHFP